MLSTKVVFVAVTVFCISSECCGYVLLTPQLSPSNTRSLYPVESEANLILQRQPRREFTAGSRQSSSCSSPVKNGSLQTCNYPDDIVECYNKEIVLLPCYCMSNDSLVGHCQFSCFRKTLVIAPNLTSLLEEQCGPFNRTGRFCGECNPGTSMPAYSFSLKCVHCKWSWKNVFKYVALAYGPLTVFLIVLIIFRVSINSAPLLGFIFVAQVSSTAFQMRLGEGMLQVGHYEPYQVIGVKLLGTIYGIWNLDFFRSIIPPFCIHPQLSTIQVMCLDYLIASYPCIVILVTYTIIEFHSRGYKLFVFLWKPFHCCFARFRNQLKIKTSLVDAFGTFFSLSYAKTLSTTADILAVTQVWDETGKEKGYHVYYEPSRSVNDYFLFLSLSLAFFIVFNLLPVIVLFVYSLRKPSQQTLVPIEERGYFRPLMNTLLDSYRDGSDGGWNCRFFCVVYLIARGLLFGFFMLTLNIFFQLVAIIILLLTGLLVALIKPYKSNVYNTVDTVLMLSLALSYTAISAYFFAHFISPMSVPDTLYLPVFPFLIPLLYITGLLGYNVCIVSRIPQRAIKKMSKWPSSLRMLLKRIKRRLQSSPQYRNPAGIRIATTTIVTVESETHCQQ